MLRFFLLCLLIAVSPCVPLRIAVVGEGVIGLSTALAIKEQSPDTEVQIFHDKPFDEILSKNIAGLFRIDDGKYKIYGNETFSRLAQLWRTHGGLSGVQLVSGHILSDNMDNLIKQEMNYGDIVYNFRFMKKWEMESQFVLNDSNSHAIHYTAFTSEGARYCPWMRKELIGLGVKFQLRKINSMDELADESFDVVVNCAGLAGGKLAGDDDSVFPIRGVLLKVDAPWQKHFLYRDFWTISIPTIDGVYVGTVKQDHATNPEWTEEDIHDIWDRYTALQPAMKNVTILSHYVGFRPGRDTIRVEAQERTSLNGTQYLAVHNYGHGGNGFTLGWGTGLHAAALALGRSTEKFESIKTSGNGAKIPVRNAARPQNIVRQPLFPVEQP